MPSLRILVTGGSGLLGQYLNMELSKMNTILTLYNSNVGNCKSFPSLKADVTDESRMEEVFSLFRPYIVVHTASVSRPEVAAKMSRGEVWKHNVGACEILARLCLKFNAKIIYTSTDLVYDGNTGGWLKEEAPLNPISLYAETKLQGENAIREVFDNYIILRTSLLYGLGLNHTRSQFQQMYKSFHEGEKVRLFYDQFRTPLSLINAAGIISGLCRLDIKGEVLNFGGKERLSRLELGEVLCREAGFDESLIVKTSMYDIADLPKVEDVSMDTSRLRNLGARQTGIKESIQEILKF